MMDTLCLYVYILDASQNRSTRPAYDHLIIIMTRRENRSLLQLLSHFMCVCVCVCVCVRPSHAFNGIDSVSLPLCLHDRTNCKGTPKKSTEQEDGEKEWEKNMPRLLSISLNRHVLIRENKLYIYVVFGARQEKQFLQFFQQLFPFRFLSLRASI